MMSRMLARCAFVLALAGALVAGTASAADLHVMISAGFYGAYAELGPAFERATGHRLVTTRGPSVGDSPEAIPTRLAKGETADVVILDDASADELGRRGFVRPDTKVEFARSQIGMVVRAGAPKPDIGTVDAFRSVLLAAKSIGYSDSSSGTYLATTLFARLGGDMSSARAVQSPAATATATAAKMTIATRLRRAPLVPCCSTPARRRATPSRCNVYVESAAQSDTPNNTFGSEPAAVRRKNIQMRTVRRIPTWLRASL